MSGGYLFGWDPAAEKWVKVECDSDGKLIIDPTAIFEDTPSDAELAKAPPSNWAYDHEHDGDAHHDEYTDVKARGAIDNIFDSFGNARKTIKMGYQQLTTIKAFTVRYSVLDRFYRTYAAVSGAPGMSLKAYSYDLPGYVDTYMRIWFEDTWVLVIHQGTFQAELANYLEAAPTEVINKAPTSNWAYDHEHLSTAHHTKYTDLEAQAACNLDGDLYLTIAGIDFNPYNPDTDIHRKMANGSLNVGQADTDIYTSVKLPDGATITEVKIMGDATAEESIWRLNRVTSATRAAAYMATAAVNTADTTISYASVDNSTYMYLLSVADIGNDGYIYYARIKYTL